MALPPVPVGAPPLVTDIRTAWVARQAPPPPSWPCPTATPATGLFRHGLLTPGVGVTGPSIPVFAANRDLHARGGGGGGRFRGPSRSATNEPGNKAVSGGSNGLLIGPLLVPGWSVHIAHLKATMKRGKGLATADGASPRGCVHQCCQPEYNSRPHQNELKVCVVPMQRIDEGLT